MKPNLIHVYVGISHDSACQNIDPSQGLAYVGFDDIIIATANIFLNIPATHPWSEKLISGEEIEIYGDEVNEENPLTIRMFGYGAEFKKYQHTDRSDITTSAILYDDSKYISDDDIVIYCTVTCNDSLEEVAARIGLYVARTAAAEQ